MARNDAYKGQLLIRGSSLATIWPWRLLVFSFALFVSILVIFAGLVFWHRPALEREVALTDTELAQLAETVPRDEQERFLQFYGQLLSLQDVLGSHISASRIFAWFEGNTNSRVFFSNLEVSVPDRKVTVQGIADSYEVLAEQLEIYRQSSDLERFFVSQSQLGGDGRVSFRAELVFVPSVFKS